MKVPSISATDGANVRDGEGASLEILGGELVFARQLSKADVSERFGGATERQELLSCIRQKV